MSFPLRLMIWSAFAIAPLEAASLENLGRQTESEIRASVLAETPVGRTLQEVLETIRINEWGNPRTLKYDEYQNRGAGWQLVPMKQVYVVLKHFPAGSFVAVHWTFDEHDRLTEVWVWKPH